MGTLFNEWLGNTKKLQTEAYKIDYSKFEGQSPESLNNIIEYLRWNMLAIDDELAEIRKEISWKPWQHDDPYVNREAVVKECVDVLHFVANIICAVGGTDEQLDAYYVNKMEVNRQRQLKGYVVKAEGMKCQSCARALDDFDTATCPEAQCSHK
jgi:hypothetical protein